MDATNEIMISSGMHQFQHGRITAIDTATVIPFAHVQLRNRNGELSTIRGAYVPLKYCVEIDQGCTDAFRAAAKEARKARRAALKALGVAPAPAAKPINWN